MMTFTETDVSQTHKQAIRVAAKAGVKLTTLSHIVEHLNLVSLAISDNIVWSTVTSCWTVNLTPA